MIDLKNKVILLTGASRGIGATTARTLAKAGANLILHYGSSPQEAQETAEAVGLDHCQVVQANLAEPGSTAALWKKAVEWKGHIDVLINNAATMPRANINDTWESWREAWTSTLQVNLISVADLCREAILSFQARGGGIIINIASRAAFRGDGPEFTPYAASKGGIISLTRTLARGFAKDGVLAYAIAPGFVHTDRIERIMQERGRDYVCRDNPMGSPAPPEDVANVIAFLASGLAPHATGTTVDINGASYVH